jgi:hypothetical protein
MSAYTDLYDDILPDAPGCPTALALQKIRQAVIEACTLADLYKVTLTVNTVAGTPVYTLPVPDQTVMVRPLAVFYNGNEIDPASEDELDALWGHSWRDPADTDDSKYYFSPDQNQVQLAKSPASTITSGLKVQIALKPTWTSTLFPDDLLANQRELIQHRTLGLLMEMARKPWSNPALAGYHNTEFQIRIGGASITAARSRVKTPLRSRPVYR